MGTEFLLRADALSPQSRYNLDAFQPQVSWSGVHAALGAHAGAASGWCGAYQHGACCVCWPYPVGCRHGWEGGTGPMLWSTQALPPGRFRLTRAAHLMDITRRTAPSWPGGCPCHGRQRLC